MTRHERDVEIATLEAAIAYNTAMLNSTCHGRDEKTEARIAADCARLNELRATTDTCSSSQAQ